MFGREPSQCQSQECVFGSLDHLMRSKPRITTISAEAYIMFGSLDHLMRNMPRITTISEEAYIMLSNNKTMDWLKCQDKQIQKQLLQESRKEVKDVRRRFKERQQSTEEGQIKRMEEEAVKAKLLEQERCMDRIIHHGLSGHETY